MDYQIILHETQRFSAIFGEIDKIDTFYDYLLPDAKLVQPGVEVSGRDEIMDFLKEEFERIDEFLGTSFSAISRFSTIEFEMIREKRSQRGTFHLYWTENRPMIYKIESFFYDKLS
jgi:hypothetical protein